MVQFHNKIQHRFINDDWIHLHRYLIDNDIFIVSNNIYYLFFILIYFLNLFEGNTFRVMILNNTANFSPTTIRL